MVVLEGVLTTPTYTGKIRRKLAPADEWEWSKPPILSTVDWASRHNVSIEVVTFMGREVADAAADWLERYSIPVSEVLSVDFDMFCRSLMWRLYEIDRVVDSDPDRLNRYGQMGYGASFGQVY